MKQGFSLGDFAASLLKLLGIYLLILLFAALVTPLVAMFFPARVEVHSTLFCRIFDRLRYVGFFIFLPLLWRMSGIKGWKDLGWSKAGTGVVLALLGMLSVFGLGYSLAGGFEGATLPHHFGWIVVKGILGAAFVALLEEFVFRGVLQRYLTKSAGLCVGVLVAALVYAFLHGRPETSGISGHGFAKSFGLWWLYVNGSSFLLPKIVFVNLSLLGIAFGVLYARSRSLWPSIGLHFGVVAAAVPLAAVLKTNGIPTMEILGAPMTTMLLMTWIAVAIFVPMGNGKCAGGEA